jgi:amidase
MTSPDLWKLDATAQAALVRGGEVTPAELVDVAIARIELVNPQINAVITPMFDSARRQARDGDYGGGPFAGVPMLLKDASLEVEGTPYYIGTRVLHDVGYRSQRTTELAHRFRRAGFIFLGKTNVPELSSDITTEPEFFGPTRNPWDLARTVGGSSGGSAAAVAAGMAAIAHGADGTGSLRFPAACCGVATLKPSSGRVPHTTPAEQPDQGRAWTEFVLARSVRDLAGVLDAVAGPERGDTRTAPPPERPFVEEMTRPPDAMRVGLLTRDVMAGMSVDQECVRAVERTGAMLASLGHEVEESHPPALEGLFGRMAGLGGVVVVARCMQIRWLERVVGRQLAASDLESQNFVTPEQAAAVSAMQFIEGLAQAEREMRPVHDWWAGGHDLLVTPVLRQPPWLLGTRGGAVDSGLFPHAFSFTGQPALSLPLHWTADGLPVGVQIVAAYGREDLLLRVAAQLEVAMPWTDRWPPIATETSGDPIP